MGEEIGYVFCGAKFCDFVHGRALGQRVGMVEGGAAFEEGLDGGEPGGAGAARGEEWGFVEGDEVFWVRSFRDWRDVSESAIRISGKVLCYDSTYLL